MLRRLKVLLIGVCLILNTVICDFKSGGRYRIRFLACRLGNHPSRVVNFRNAFHCIVRALTVSRPSPDMCSLLVARRFFESVKFLSVSKKSVICECNAETHLRFRGNPAALFHGLKRTAFFTTYVLDKIELKMRRCPFMM